MAICAPDNQVQFEDECSKIPIRQNHDMDSLNIIRLHQNLWYDVVSSHWLVSFCFHMPVTRFTPNAVEKMSMHAIYIAYACWSLRISESPASRMAMVEQRKSLPQAVPSSIYTDIQVSKSEPSKVKKDFFAGQRTRRDETSRLNYSTWEADQGNK